MTRLVAPLALSLALSACGPAAPDDGTVERTEHDAFHLQVAADEGALRRGRNALTVRAWSRDGRPARVEQVFAVMPSHNHDTVTADVTAQGDAARVDNLTLAMPGRWQITLRVGDGTTSDAAIWWVYIP